MRSTNLHFTYLLNNLHTVVAGAAIATFGFCLTYLFPKITQKII